MQNLKPHPRPPQSESVFNKIPRWSVYMLELVKSWAEIFAFFSKHSSGGNRRSSPFMLYGNGFHRGFCWRKGLPCLGECETAAPHRAGSQTWRICLLSEPPLWLHFPIWDLLIHFSYFLELSLPPPLTFLGWIQYKSRSLSFNLALSQAPCSQWMSLS